jgi:hypothetical protein
MAIVINGSGTVTGLSVGGLPDGTVDAGTLATNSVDSAELIDGAVDDSHMASISGRKNLIINGAMRINQRGSVNTTDAGGEYALDRWETYLRGGAAATVSQATDVPTGQGFGNSLKIDVTTGDAFGTSNDLALLRTKWEGQDLQQLAYGTSSAKTLTLSFWIKSTITGNYMCSLNNNDDNDRMNNRSYTISSANTWEKKTLTFNGDTSAGTINNDNAGSIELRFWLASGSNYNTGTLSSDGNWEAYNVANQAVGHVNSLNSASNNIYLTGVQLELGSTATDFEYRSYGEELALCQRYYHRIGGGGDTTILMTTAPSTTECAMHVQLPTVMRAKPSISWTNTGASMAFRYAGNNSTAFTPSAVNSLNLGEFTNTGGSIWFSGFNHGQTSNGAGHIRTGSGQTNYLQFDAEL